MESAMLQNSLMAMAVIAAGTFSASAQTCEATPQFSTHRTSNSSVRAQYNALERGDFRQSIHFGEAAIQSGTSARHRVAAMSNLCVAYAQTGETQRAIEACDEAIELSSNSWRAYNNRGVIRWTEGDYSEAQSDFQAASDYASNEEEVRANLQASQCSS